MPVPRRNEPGPEQHVPHKLDLLDGVRFKRFPPGIGSLRIPTSSYAAALTGLAMYTPCKLVPKLLLKTCWFGVSYLGPAVLPGLARPWRPDIDDEVFGCFVRRWRETVGSFDSVAGYERTQVDRPGILFLLIKEGIPLAFAKLEQSPKPAVEYRALSALSKHRPHSFWQPLPLAYDAVGAWRCVLVSPLPPVPHSKPRYPPIELITNEIQEALKAYPKPTGVPPHWQPMHGDFTPWNLRKLPDGRLALIDWADTSWGPPGADKTLYLACEAALTGSVPPSLNSDEAVKFWLDRIRLRPARQMREHKLKAALEEALLSMRRPGRRTESKPALARRPRVLVFAYACEPERGSEPGAGWGLVRAVSRFADCVVLTAPEHIASLESWKKRNPLAPIQFVQVPEARWSTHSRWHRLPWFVSYLAWLRRAARIGHRLHTESPFDLVHHATYAVYWLPTPAIGFGVPCVWGPVGGGVRTPLRLWAALGVRGLFDEILDLIAVRIASRWPQTRRTQRSVAKGLIQNEETFDHLPREVKAKSQVLNHAVFTEVPVSRPGEPEPFFLSVGALETRKGVRLIVRALSRTPHDIRLRVIGRGPEESTLRKLAKQLAISHRVEFLGHLPREELACLMSKSSGVVLTGLREEGGLAVAEAMLSGVPVIVLANGGARTIAERAIDASRVRLVPATEAVQKLADAMTELIRDPPLAREPNLDSESFSQVLETAFRETLAESEDLDM